LQEVISMSPKLWWW